MKAFEQIINDLNNRIFKPVYFLHGEESYFIDAITKHISDHVLSDAEKSFNQTVYYGKDTDITTIIDTARRFPMMASHQVVIVKEAQHLKNLKLLEVYAVAPMKSTILVFAWKGKKVDSRLKVFKEIKKHGVLYEAPRVYANKVGPWIQTYLDTKGVKIHPEAIMLLSESIGANLSRLSGVLDKLIVVKLEDEEMITAEMVQENIGIHRDFNVFEFQKALGMRDARRAYQIADYFSKEPKSNPAIMIIPRIFDYFCKLITFHVIRDKSKQNVAAELGVSTYFVDEYVRAARNYPPGKLVRIVSYLRQADAQNKGVDAASINDSDLYKELIFKILH